jgi:hypothetical protein
MCAEFADEAEAAVGIAAGDQTLRQQFHTNRCAVVLRQLFGQQCRQPVTAEHRTHRGPGAGLCQQIVLFLPKHGRSDLRQILCSSSVEA